MTSFTLLCPIKIQLIERYMFNLRKQQSGESIDDYVTDLYNLANSCKLCDCLGESLLRDRITMGVRDLESRKKTFGKKI